MLVMTVAVATITSPLLFTGDRGYAAPAASAGDVHSQAPTWELKDVQGKIVKSSDFKDKVVILDFWATWCPPCRKEIPDLVELQNQYRDKGVVIIGISVDEEGPKVVSPFIKKNNLNYPVVMATASVQSKFGGISSIPTTFVFDRHGQIVSKHVGFTEKSEFENEIKPLL